jgi:hypothetical protein
MAIEMARSRFRAVLATTQALRHRVGEADLTGYRGDLVLAGGRVRSLMESIFPDAQKLRRGGGPPRRRGPHER